MGLDMWLPSVFDYKDETSVHAALGELPQARSVEEIQACATLIYDRLRATGAYYREGYNRFGLLPHLGLSWHEIYKQLPDHDFLPIDHARFLLAELETLPVTEDRVRRVVSGVDDGSPIAWALERMSDQKYEPPPMDRLDEACAAIYSQLVTRRSELMALLRLAIERNEPLRISG
jgi:hypothetical protein